MQDSLLNTWNFYLNPKNRNMKTVKNDFLSIVSLFTSFSTLICCALPALLVVLGLGAVVAGVSDFPLLITLSKNKGWVFCFAFALMAINFFLVYRKKKEALSCEFVPGKKESACEVASRWSKVILWISFILLLIGFFVSYLLLPIIKLFE